MKLATLGLAFGVLACSPALLAQSNPRLPEVTVSGSSVAAGAKQARLKYGNECVWNGSTGNFSDASKWSCGEVPGPLNGAYIESGHVVLDVSPTLGELVLSGGTLEVNTPQSLRYSNTEFTQYGGRLRITENGSLHHNQGHRYVQEGGELELRFASASQYGRMNFDNGIGGLGLYGLGGTLRLVGVNGFAPSSADQFEIMRGSSLSQLTAGYIPALVHDNFPSNFRAFLGQFSGVVRDAFSGACLWDGSSNDWSHVPSWSCGRVPGASDRAVVLEGGPTVTDSAVVGTLVMEGGRLAWGPDTPALTALGEAGNNSLSGAINIRPRGRLAVRGDTYLVSGLSLELDGELVNEGSLVLQHRVEDFGAPGMRVWNDSPPARAALVNHGSFSVQTQGTLFFDGQVTLLNHGFLRITSSDPVAPAILEMGDDGELRQAGGHSLLQNVDVRNTLAVVLEGGEMQAQGSFSGAISNSGGFLRPGPECSGGGGALRWKTLAKDSAYCSDVGALSVGTYTQGPSGRLEIQARGASFDQHDELQVQGLASIAGQLDVRLLESFAHTGFGLIQAATVSGTFATVENDFAPDFRVGYLPGAVILEPEGPPPPDVAPTITSAPPPANGRVGDFYTHAFSATGSPTPAFFVSSGQLPPGLDLTLQGVLSGTPTTPGSFTAIVTAANAVAPDATQAFTITIAPLVASQPAQMTLEVVPPISYGSIAEFRVIPRHGTTGVPIADGTVQVSVGGVVACTVVLPGEGCFTETAYEVGSHAVQAILSAPGFDAASATGTLVIDKRATTVRIDGPVSAQLGQPITLVLSLRRELPTDEALAPTGTLTLRHGAAVLCQAQVSGAPLSCAFTPATTDPADLVAEYSGDARYEASATPRRIVVNDGTGLEVGDIVPDFEVFDQSGARRTLREFAGKYVMIDFCAAWCGPCRSMAYEAGRVQRSFAPGSFEYLTVIMENIEATGVSGQADAIEWYSEHPIFKAVMHRGGIADPLAASPVAQFYHGLFATDSYPTLVVLDPEQRMRHKSQGAITSAQQVALVAAAMGVAPPPLAPRFVAEDLGQVRLTARAGSTPLANTAIGTRDAIGHFTFATGTAWQASLVGTLIDANYDEHREIRIEGPAIPTNVPITLALDSLGWSDGFVRNFMPGRVSLWVNDVHEARVDDAPTLTDTSISFTLPLFAKLAFVPPLPPNTPVTSLSLEMRFDVDFGSTRAMPPLEPPPPPAPEQRTLTVTKSGAGSGTVTSTPAGIACGANCAAAFPEGAQVALAAIPNQGSRFIGWSGACIGATTCSVQLAQPAAVNARFELDLVAPRITSGALPDGTMGLPYLHAFTASGSAPIAFSLVSGSLPAGLTLSSNGVLSGTPLQAGEFGLRVRAANGASPAAERTFTLAIATGAPARLEIVRGNHQVGFLDPRAPDGSEPFARPLVVRLVDAFGRGISGRRVEFTPMALASVNTGAATASLSPTSALTDASGFAQSLPTPRGTTGAYEVRARVEGFEPVFFTLGNSPIDLRGPFSLGLGLAEATPQSTMILSRFAQPLRVRASDSRTAVPGQEVRFFAAGEGPSARLEGGKPGVDGKRAYRSVVTDRSGMAEVAAFANVAGGKHEVVAVLVAEDAGNTPETAEPSRRVAFALENRDDLAIRIDRRSDGQAAEANRPFAEALRAQVALTGERLVGADAELWFFAGDDARGEPGANFHGPGVIEGVLPGGERYAAAPTSASGFASVNAIANRFDGPHTVTVAYPGDYATLKEARFTATLHLENKNGDKPDFGNREGKGSAIEVASGDFQAAQPGTKAFPFPLVVRVTDAEGKPALGGVRFVPLDANTVIAPSLVDIDRDGFAAVTATPATNAANATARVRATVVGTTASVDFTLTIDARATAPAASIQPVASGPRGDERPLGSGQAQVVLARFDEPLAVQATLDSRTQAAGREVRYFVPEGNADGKARPTIEIEGAPRHTWLATDGRRIPYWRAVTDDTGIAHVTGLASPQAGTYEVVAMVTDPSPGGDNDPASVPADRLVRFTLTNVEPGAVITRLAGHEQSTTVGRAFTQPLTVRVSPSVPPRTGAVPRPLQRGAADLDGAEVWFMTPVVDEKTAGGILVGGDDHRIGPDEKGFAWNVLAVPVGEDGTASATVVSNGVQGGHRVFVAYPGAFADPASAPSRASFWLCNASSSRATCVDPGTPASIEPAATPLLSYGEAFGDVAFVVRNDRGQPVEGATVNLTTRSPLLSLPEGWTLDPRDQQTWRTTAITGADGRANAGRLAMSQPGGAEVFARVDGVADRARVELFRYLPAQELAATSPTTVAAFVNTRHDLGVRMRPVAPTRWTVVPGAGGAGGSFVVNGAATYDFITTGSASPGEGTIGLALAANGVAGTFTVRVEVIGQPQVAPVVFTITNLAGAPLAPLPLEEPYLTFGAATTNASVVVRNNAGAPLSGIPVTFRADASLFELADGAWVRNAATGRMEKVVVTGADGIASPGRVRSLAPGRATMEALVVGHTLGSQMDFYHFAQPEAIVSLTPSPNSAPVGGEHDIVVRAMPTAPLRWTIVPGPGGASGTFALEGGTAIDLVRPPTQVGRSDATQPADFTARIRPNSTAGPFTLRIEVIGRPDVFLEIPMFNTRTAPVAIAAPAPIVTYGEEAEAVFTVRDANGAAVEFANVRLDAVTSALQLSDPAWRIVGPLPINAARELVTNGAGRVGSGRISVKNIGATTVSARVQGVALPAQAQVLRYAVPTTFRPEGGIVAGGTRGQPLPEIAVLTQPAAPIRWTIVPAANGAGASFAGASGTTADSIVTPSTAPAGAVHRQSLVANGIAGTFTVKAEVLGQPGLAPVVFSVTTR